MLDASRIFDRDPRRGS